jgi:hypothetical protein
VDLPFFGKQSMLFVAGWGSNQKRESREWQCLPVTQREGASLSCQQDTHATCINAEFEDECLSSQRKTSPPGVCGYVCQVNDVARAESIEEQSGCARRGARGREATTTSKDISW